jgi:hypothetical protein
MTPNPLVPDSATVSELLSRYEEQGYVTSFSVVEGGGLRCGACRTVSDASTVSVTALSRAEGASDPDDMAAVAVVTCPWCSMAGTVVLGYGPSASPDDADVLELLSDDRPEGEPAVLRAVDPPA